MDVLSVHTSILKMCSWISDQLNVRHAFHFPPSSHVIFTAVVVLGLRADSMVDRLGVVGGVLVRRPVLSVLPPMYPASFSQNLSSTWLSFQPAVYLLPTRFCFPCSIPRSFVSKTWGQFSYVVAELWVTFWSRRLCFFGASRSFVWPSFTRFRGFL